MKKMELRIRKSGFTLMEILTSLIVVSIVAMGFLGNTVYVKRNSAMMQQKMIAWQLIDQKFAKIKIDNGNSTALGFTSEEVLELRNGVMTLNATTAQPGNDTNLKQVVATVRWDLPWRDQVGRCDLISGRTCDKQESAVALFFEGFS